VNAKAAEFSISLINFVQTGPDGRFSHAYVTGGCEYELSFFSKPGTLLREVHTDRSWQNDGVAGNQARHREVMMAGLA
jgi:hypothetical protein